MTGLFADVGHSRSLAYLRSAEAPLLIRYRITDLDAAAIRLSAPRELTQHLSRLIYECVSGQGPPQFDGARYLSRLVDDIANWALFQRPDQEASTVPLAQEPIDADDPILGQLSITIGLSSRTDGRQAVRPFRPRTAAVPGGRWCGRRRPDVEERTRSNMAAGVGVLRRPRRRRPTGESARCG